MPAVEVRVRTQGGPSGWFSVGDDPPVRQGWRNPVTVPAGSHELRVYAADGTTVVYTEQLELVGGEPFSRCVDLSRGLPCGQ